MEVSRNVSFAKDFAMAALVGGIFWLVCNSLTAGPAVPGVGFGPSTLPTELEQSDPNFEQVDPETGWTGKPLSTFFDHTDSDGHRSATDLGTGLFEHWNTDFYLPGEMPIIFTREYRSRDSLSGAFGLATRLNYDAYLSGDANGFPYIDIILQNGSQIHFHRVSPGTDLLGAQLVTDAIMSSFYGSLLFWDRGGWTVKWPYYANFRFLACPPTATHAGESGLVEIQTPRGRIKITRDHRGNVRRIESSSGAWLNVYPDEQDRIKLVTNGRTGVTYDYDSASRLIAVRDYNGGVTRYEYDDHSNMTAIKTPFGRSWVKVEYDERDRVQKMSFIGGRVDRFSYSTDPAGHIVKTEVYDGVTNGLEEIVTFDSHGIMTSDWEMPTVKLPDAPKTPLRKKPLGLQTFLQWIIRAWDLG